MIREFALTATGYKVDDAREYWIIITAIGLLGTLLLQNLNTVAVFCILGCASIILFPKISIINGSINLDEFWKNDPTQDAAIMTLICVFGILLEKHIDPVVTMTTIMVGALLAAIPPPFLYLDYKELLGGKKGKWQQLYDVYMDEIHQNSQDSDARIASYISMCVFLSVFIIGVVYHYQKDREGVR